MESLLKGQFSDEDELYEDDVPIESDDSDKDADGDGDDDGHSGLLESLGAKRRDSGRKGNALKITEFQSLTNDDRGELPTFRGVKALREARKKKKKSKVSNEEEYEQDILDEVYDDPTITKPVLERSKRSALYENVKKDVSKWNAVVYHNRVAEQLVFPLSSGEKISKRSIKDAADDFVPQTPLEEEMAKILYGDDYVQKKKAELHSKDDGKTEDESYNLSVEEALEKHNEMARLRALQSYEMAKAKRRNKIKSKKYHRLLRREKIKKQMKDFEELKLKNPEAAMEKLQELEVSRIRERMTLKHRNTSKWAKSHAARAKYDKDSRIALSEQLKLSKDLTQKQAISSDESEDEEVEDERPQKDGDAYQIKDLNIDPSEFNIETLSNSKKFSSLNLLALRSLATPEAAPEVDHSLTSASLINPKNFLVINPKFNAAKELTINSELLEDDSEVLNEEEDQRMVIAEAFEDDDVVADFRQRKSDEVESSKPKDVDLTLPGWGDWGGSGVVKRKKKQKRFLRKGPLPPPRKDARMSHVIINEAANAKIREHQVRNLPFPFKRVQDFEKSIRAPIGRTWLPEKAVKNLIAPKVITKLGAVIKPLSEDFLVKKTQGRNSVGGGGHVKLVGGVKIIK